jgi:hypothetical protein
MSVEHAASTKQQASAGRYYGSGNKKPGYGRHVCSRNVGKEGPQPRATCLSGSGAGYLRGYNTAEIGVAPAV